MHSRQVALRLRWTSNRGIKSDHELASRGCEVLAVDLNHAHLQTAQRSAMFSGTGMGRPTDPRSRRRSSLSRIALLERRMLAEARILRSAKIPAAAHIEATKARLFDRDGERDGCFRL